MLQNLYRYFCFCFLILVLPVAAKAESVNFLHEIQDLDAWHSVSARPVTNSSARTEAVKFLYDQQDQNLYFANTQKWSAHYHFVRDNLNKDYDHALFNKREYMSADRRYIMGSLVHYIDGDHWVMEIAPSDTMTPEMLILAYKNLVTASFMGNKIQFRSQAARQDKMLESLQGQVPILKREDFQKTIQYQALTLTTGYGYLRFVKGNIDPATVRPDQILVTEYVPDDLPVCAGLVTSQLQAPLAHVSILLEGRRTANMALRGAIDRLDMRSLEGTLVKLDVGAQDYTLAPTTLAEAQAWWSQHRPLGKVAPVISNNISDLSNVCDVSLQDTGSVGGKASYMGGLCQLQNRGVKAPDGFVIPIEFYVEHMKRAGLNKYVDMLVQSEGGQDGVSIETQLTALQNGIMQMPISQGLVKDVRARIAKWGDTKAILRSSANAEDIQGFVGAGLYKSKVIDARASTPEIKSAIRSVWASLWTIRAYKERDWYRIDHGTSAMAILVQPFVQNVKANGVAITANPYDHRRPGYFVNVQTMEGSITSAKSGTLPESLLVHKFRADEELSIDILSRSTLNGGEVILSDKALEKLVKDMDAIHMHFIPAATHSSNRAMDIEFLVTNDDQIIIVQARPYTVNYRSELKHP